MNAPGAVDVVRDGDWLVAAWHGEIDMTNAEALQQHTLGSMHNTDSGLTVDLTGVSYIDSVGIRSLLAIRRLLGISGLASCIGCRYELDDVPVIPLPHPSGASGWLNSPTNRGLTAKAAALVRAELGQLGRG